MQPTDFTPYSSLAGGLLIGLSASLLLWMNGRVAGISGILAGLWGPPDERSWRVAFVVSLIAVGVFAAWMAPARVAFGLDRSLPLMALGGLLVGVGTRVGGGCTSGHGVCGNARLSPRSLIATVTFIATGMLTVVLLRTIGATA
jgi:uncharacterized membrane protein YedE/YeeE